MSAALARPVIAPSDRLALTLCCAIVVHATVILGVSFSPPSQKPLDRPLDVILVHQKNPEKPKEAEVLAQAAQEGGGDSAEKAPATPSPPPSRTASHIAAARPPAGRAGSTLWWNPPTVREPPSRRNPPTLTVAQKKAGRQTGSAPAEQSDPAIVKAPVPDAEALINVAWRWRA